MFRGVTRRAVAIASLIGIAACSSDLTAPPRNAEIVFRLDAASCHGSSVFELFIDGDHAGSRPMSPGDSATFAVAPGDHSAGATAPTVNGVSIWFPQTVTLAAGQRYVLTMRC